MEGLFPVQSAGQRLISPSLYRGIGSVSIRRSVTGFSMDTRISSRSPSQFTIRSQQVEIAQAYERGGAAFLSVLTDQKYFKALEAIRSAGVKVFSLSKLSFLLLLFLNDEDNFFCLVGESIVKQNDPEKGIAGLFGRTLQKTFPRNMVEAGLTVDMGTAVHWFKCLCKIEGKL
ncbi:hypothetical protein HID58_086521 [Brassica napus]|uniref:indole-3-glycerol-phosphate synthase n=1 Tax=Brassica napus TaxID=3708 RepID=A0ABQ7XQK5_BRANA|nr:hypothetical protein HID58_086521 [Brassica napus]